MIYSIAALSFAIAIAQLPVDATCTKKPIPVLTSPDWFVDERLKSLHMDPDTKPLVLIRADADKLDTTHNDFMSKTFATVGVHIRGLEDIFSMSRGTTFNNETAVVETMK